MSSSFVALFTVPTMEAALAQALSDEATGEFVDSVLEESPQSLLIGSTTDGWILSAVTDYLESRNALPAKGSAAGSRAYEQCDYVHFYVPSSDVGNALESLRPIKPEEDPQFWPGILSFFKQLGEDYEGYLDDGAKDYLDCVASLIEHLETALKSGGGILILIPY